MEDLHRRSDVSSIDGPDLGLVMGKESDVWVKVTLDVTDVSEALLRIADGVISMWEDGERIGYAISDGVFKDAKVAGVDGRIADSEVVGGLPA